MKCREYFAGAFLAAVFCIPAMGSAPDIVQATDTPLKIKSKPQASARGCKPGSGRTLIKATFDKSGKVTTATIVSASGCDPFDKTAMRAAHSIKFEPAKKNGEAVTTVRAIEYTYSIY